MARFIDGTDTFTGGKAKSKGAANVMKKAKQIELKAKVRRRKTPF
jgi:hypothetical protein